jgi:hypothetical protein
VACFGGKKRNAYRGNLREKDHMEYLGIDCSIILNGPQRGKTGGRELDSSGSG